MLVRRKRDLPEQPEVDSSSLTHFGESHDRLTQLLREVEPESAEWERLTKLEWRESRLDSLVHLKELVPALDEADLSFNDLRFLIGLPSTLRTLSLRANLLHSLTTFGHLRHLEYLDISDNHLETLEHLAPLRHLRELKADRNRIVSLDGLSAVDGLLKISLVGNEIETADFSSCSWYGAFAAPALLFADVASSGIDWSGSISATTLSSRLMVSRRCRRCALSSSVGPTDSTWWQTRLCVVTSLPLQIATGSRRSRASRRCPSFASCEPARTQSRASTSRSHLVCARSTSTARRWAGLKAVTS